MKTVLSVAISLSLFHSAVVAAETVTHLHGDREHTHALPADQGLTHRHGSLPGGVKLKHHQTKTTGSISMHDEVTLLYLQAEDHHQKGNYQQAVRLFKRIIKKIKEPSAKEQLMAKVYFDLGTAQLRSNELHDALTSHNKAITIRKKTLTERHPDISDSYNSIGMIYSEMGDIEKGIEYYEKSLSLKTLSSKEDQIAISTNYNNIGQNYFELGNFIKSLAYHKKALSIRILYLKNTPKLATSYNNLGLVYYRLGDFQKALVNLKEALSIRQATLTKNHPTTAQSYNNIGIVYTDAGSYRKALNYHKKAISIREAILPKNHPKLAISYNNLALVYIQKKMPTIALDYYKKSIKIETQALTKNHPSLATTYSNIGALYADIGITSKALENLQKAIFIQKTSLHKNHPSLAISYNNIGSVYGTMGFFSKELESYQRALTILTTTLPKNHQEMAAIHHNIGIAHSNLGNPIKSFKSTSKAVEIFIKNRDSMFGILSNQQKLGYLEKNKMYISSLFDKASQAIVYCIEKKRTEEAEKILFSLVNYWLNYKGTILDSENKILQFSKNSNNKNIKSLYKNLIKIKTKIALLYQKKSSHKDSKNIQQEIDKLSEIKTKIEQEISKLHPEFSKNKIASKVNKEILSKTLKTNEAYIDFAFINGAYYPFIITKTDVFISINTTKNIEITQAIEVFQRDIKTIIKKKKSTLSNQATTQAALAKLYQAFIPRIKHLLKEKDTLVISPDGLLRLLPLEALYDKKTGQYLIEQYNIRYIASGKEQVRLHLNQQLKTQRTTQLDLNEKPMLGIYPAIIFANPNFNYDPKAMPESQSGSLLTSFKKKTSTIILAKNDRRSDEFTTKFAQLEYTKTEANHIIPMLRRANKTVQDFRQEEATEGALLSVNSPTILHIATHGFFNSGQTDPMMQSGLVMASANTSISKGGQEGIVYALDLSGLDLTGTELVVLSACNTGTVDPDNTVGISSLSKAFIQAGAKDVVMSLWSVADKETASLMTEFYKASQQDNLSYSKALRQSKLKMIKEGRHPFYWAPFILSGM